MFPNDEGRDGEPQAGPDDHAQRDDAAGGRGLAHGEPVPCHLEFMGISYLIDFIIW